MKLLLTAAAFVFILTLNACSTNHTGTENEITELIPSLETEETSAVTSAASSVTSVSSVSKSTVPVSSTSVSEISTAPDSTPPDYKSVELSMLENAGDPDYHASAAIPYVAWTEVNLEKTMYTISDCYGYEFALPESVRKMIYDAGAAVEVIARTSTGYYRIKGDLYIPCELLDSVIPDGIDASAATSCIVPAITAPPVTQTAAVTYAWQQPSGVQQ